MAHLFQTVVDRDAGPAEAVVLAARLRDWLLDEQVVQPALVPCVPDGGLGHPPGRAYRSVVERDAGRLLDLAVNGVEVETGRQVVFAPRSDSTARCPSCAQELPGSLWADAVQDWYDGHDGASVECPACRTATPVTEVDLEPVWGFGHLSVTFWNWPRLSPAFLTALADRLGSRTVVVHGRR